MKDIRQKIADKVAKTAVKANTKDPEAKKVTMWRVAKFLWSPEIGPRIKALGKRFGGFAFFLAQIFYSCRLIPAGHPTLQASNIGYFGFTDVISTAASNLQLRKENIDQIVMFTAVILSMALLLANGLAIAAFTVFDFSDALAQQFPVQSAADVAVGSTNGGGSLFSAPNPDTDLALQFLDLVFGASNVDMFHYGDATNQGLGNTAIKDGIYAMLGMYSTAMMVIAVIIILYYVFTVVGESAMTGQPFGKRFNSFWAPIRLVVGLGLLVPIGGGLNAAQYGTLYAAKLGSGLASNAWSVFVTKLAETDLITDATPKPSVSALVYNIVRFETCAAVANKYGWVTGVSMVKEELRDNDLQTGTIFRWDKGANTTSNVVSTAAAITGPAGLLATQVALPSNVPAACGEIFIPYAPQSIGKNENTILGSSEVKESLVKMHDAYAGTNDSDGLINDIVAIVRPEIVALVSGSVNIEGNPEEFRQSEAYDKIKALSPQAIAIAQEVVQNVATDFKADYEDKFKEQISNKITAFNEKGWLGAGMFYTQIADLNGGLIRAITQGLPRITGDIVALPSDAQVQQSRDGAWISGDLSTVDGAAFDNETVTAMGKILANVQGAFGEGYNPEMTGARAFRQDFFTMLIADLFGAEYLDQMRQSTGVNPLADITALGYGLVSKAFNYISYILVMMIAGPLLSVVSTVMGIVLVPVSAGGSLGLSVLGVLVGFAGEAIMAAMQILILMAMMGFAVGFFLYYVIPIIPIIYFFFAVIEWLLGVVEALVGVPLWALSHLRIDGDGLGQATQTGYTIIFGIVVRPFVILFALIFSVVIYSAGMVILKEIFEGFIGFAGASEAAGGFGEFDYIAYSGVYAVLSFSLAMVSFKQIDQMHKQIMRWFGNGDPMYQDGNEDPAQRMQGAAIGFGALMATSVDNVAGAARGMSGAIGNASQGVAGKVNEKRGYEQGIISGGASDIKDGNMTQSRFDGYSAQQKSSMLNEAGVSSEAEAKAKFGFK